MFGRRTVIALGLAAVALAGCASLGGTREDAALRAVVAGPQRGAENSARDGARHPYDSLVFWGLKPHQTVIELVPGGGYWTEILAPYARATGGTYTAGVADLANPNISEGARKARAGFEAKYADSAKFGPIRYVGFGAVSGPLGAPGSADLVLTSRNIHNFIWTPGQLDKVMADAFAVLKPGGVLAVEDHRANPPAAGLRGPRRLCRHRHRRRCSGEGRLQTGRDLGNQRQSEGHQGPSLRRLDPAAGAAQRPAAGAGQPGLRSHEVRRHRRERPHDPALREASIAPL